jgi:ATP-dependent Clp endopeptidase proteolytic subunit ClpP|tara:strand:- start:1131 stop:2000 length:870 start_codon:yes stop_codon:yes gene_type:complete
MSEENKQSKEEEKVTLQLKEAQVQKLKAEAKKLEIEAKILSNNQQKQEIDIKKAQILFQKEELNFKVLAEKEKLNLKNLKVLLKKEKINLELKQLDLENELESIEIRNSRDDRNYLYRFNEKVSSESVRRCMETLTEWHRLDPECDIEIIFSSPGGSIIDGFELFDFLQDLRYQGHHLTTGTLGYAASMAGVLLQAGDVRWVGQQAWVMIHRAAFGAWGKTYEIEDEVKFIQRIEERILGIFTSRSKLTKTKIKRNWDRKDWWISADEAIDMGLVDEIRAKLPEHFSSK